jgi:hypothetical protein
MGQNFISILRYSPVNITLPMLYTQSSFPRHYHSPNALYAILIPPSISLSQCSIRNPHSPVTITLPVLFTQSSFPRQYHSPNALYAILIPPSISLSQCSIRNPHPPVTITLPMLYTQSPSPTNALHTILYHQHYTFAPHDASQNIVLKNNPWKAEIHVNNFHHSVPTSQQTLRSHYKD